MLVSDMKRHGDVVGMAVREQNGRDETQQGKPAVKGAKGRGIEEAEGSWRQRSCYETICLLALPLHSTHIRIYL